MRDRIGSLDGALDGRIHNLLGEVFSADVTRDGQDVSTSSLDLRLDTF